MTMNNILKILMMCPVAAGGMLLASCTDVEKIEIDHIGGYNTMDNAKSEAYYAKLREYKNQIWNYGRPVAFGWFSDWAQQGASRGGYLTSVPDSMDIISMWSGAPDRFEITPEQKADKEFVQKKKGIKLLEVSLLSHLGKGRTPESIYIDLYKQAKAEKWSDSQLKEAKKLARWDYWGFTSHELNNYNELAAAHSRFAKALCDSLVVNEWDGFDIDWEPGNGFNDADGTLAGNMHQNRLILHLVQEMGKYIGPKSDPEGTGHKLLCVDGQISIFCDDCPEYIDYFILQSYGRVDDLDYYVPNTHKFILTENFEQFASIGGQLFRQASYMPASGYKGGVGAYRFQKDYDNTPDYKYMRRAIQENQRVFNEWKAAQAKDSQGENSDQQ